MSMQPSDGRRNRLRVMLVVETSDILVDWGLAAATGSTFSTSSVPDLFSREFSLDHGYPPVPIGTQSATDDPIVFANHLLSKRMVVRGHIDIDDAEKIPERVEGAKVYSDPIVRPFPSCVDSPAIGKQAQAKHNLDTAFLLEKGLDGSGVAVAIMDSGINLKALTTQLGHEPALDADNSWIPDGFTLGPGEYLVDHGTMCAYDTLLAAPKATLLDYPFLIARGFAVHDSERTVSDALAAFAWLQKKWAANIAQGNNAKYRALVVNNSWGIFNRELETVKLGHEGRYIDNPKHIFHDSVSALARAGADILFAAGNCGAGCADPNCWGHKTESIMGANSYAEVLTIAACDINDKRLDYSSQGPSIKGMPQEKPDLTMYSHFQASEVAGKGAPDGGTSAACAVASGCVAALRTKISRIQTPPALLFKRLKDTARQVVPGGRNDDYGYGIMDPGAAAKGLV